MPSHIPANRNSLQKRAKVPPRRPIRKEVKNMNQRSVGSPSDCDCDENTMAEVIVQEVKSQRISTQKELVSLIRNLISRSRYSIDTYFVTLSLLQKIKFQIPHTKARLLSAALLLLAAKVHEFRTPRFCDLLGWGEHVFGASELIQAEADLLMHFNFRIPAVLAPQSVIELEIEVARLEKNLFETNTNFQ